MQAKDILSPADYQSVLYLLSVKSYENHHKPVSMTKIQESNFFPSHENSYEGYFIWVGYDDGLFQIWLVVDMRSNGNSDDGWFLERIA